MELAEIMSVLKTARRRHGLKIHDIATIVGATESTVAQWEKGTRAPALDKLQAYADAVKVTVTVTPEWISNDLTRSAEDPELRATRLLGEVLRVAIDIRGDDLTRVHKRISKLPTADLVAAVVLAAACIDIDRPQRDLLAWWTGQDLAVSDLVSTCAWCGDHFIHSPNDKTRVYCSGTCRHEAWKDRRRARYQGLETAA